MSSPAIGHTRDSAARLPVRPTPYPDEWCESYLGRFARSLGLRRPWRHDFAVLRPLLPAGVQGTVDGAPMYEGELLPGWAVLPRGGQIRYCPMCLESERYIRARWRIAPLMVCTVHIINLKDGLVEPAVTSAYNGSGKRLIGDILLESIWEGASSPLPSARTYAQTIWAPFEKAVLSGCRGSELQEPLAWALLAERLIDAVVTSVRGPDYPPLHVPRNEHRAGWLASAGLQIAPNREGVLSFLLALTVGAHRRAAIACLGRLVDDEVRRRTVMSRLPLQWFKDRLLAAAPAIKERQSGALPRGLHPEWHTSFEATLGILGCQDSLLMLFVNEKLIEGALKIRFGRKQYVFIPDAEVERMRRFLCTCMTFDQLLERLSIDRVGYWALHDSGLLKPIEFGAWRRYRRSEVENLLIRLDGVAIPMPARAIGLQPLMGSWLHRRGRTRACMTRVLLDAVGGRLTLYRSLAQTGLAAYFVDYNGPMRLRTLSEADHASRAVERGASGQLTLWHGA